MWRDCNEVIRKRNYCCFLWRKEFLRDLRWRSFSCLNQARCTKRARLPVQSSQKHYSKMYHDDVIKWKHFPRYWPFVRGIHRRPVNSLHKGQWRGALMFSLICVWINGWVNNREAGDLRRYRAYYDVIVMWSVTIISHWHWCNWRLIGWIFISCSIYQHRKEFTMI